MGDEIIGFGCDAAWRGMGCMPTFRRCRCGRGFLSQNQTGPTKQRPRRKTKWNPKVAFSAVRSGEAS